VNDLALMLERRVAFVQRQPGERLLLALPRLVTFVDSEPRLRGIADDIRAEYDDGLSRHRTADRELADALLDLWNGHSSWFLAAWDAEVAGTNEEPVWAKAYGGPPSTLAERLSRAGDYELPRFKEPVDPGIVGAALSALEHWLKCIEGSSLPEKSQRRAFVTALGEIQDRHARVSRDFLVLTRSHPGAALKRLSEFATSLALPLTESDGGDDDDLAGFGRYLSTLDRRRVGNTALGLGQFGHEKGDLKAYAEQILRDIEAVSEEIQHRLGLHLSHRALVRRFKTRTERFEAEQLRCLVEAHPNRKPEDILTLAAARYLFDRGLNPLFNASIVTLRPDLFDASEPFSLYIEAKQYLKAPRAELLKGVWQLWDTWSELDGSHQVREAFLLVFRRGGPLVVFDGSPPRLLGRTLHPLVVDIAPIEEKGSRAQAAPIHISNDELLPTGGGT